MNEPFFSFLILSVLFKVSQVSPFPTSPINPPNTPYWYNNLDGSQGHYVSEKKVIPKGHKPWLHLYNILKMTKL